MTGTDDLGAWLRRQREARAWTRTEMARQLIKAARARDDKSLPGADDICHNIYRWERGKSGLSERYKLLYCTALGIAAAGFGHDQPGGSHDASPAPAVDAAGSRQAVIVIVIPDAQARHWKDAALAAGTGSDVQQRYPFAVNIGHALETLGLAWGDAYSISCEDGEYTAVSQDDGHRVITGQTPDELMLKIRADWARVGAL